MAPIFADTSGWANLVDRTEPFHGVARVAYQRVVATRGRFITTNYILTELVAVMERPLRIPRSQAIQFLDGIVRSPNVEVVHITADIHHQAWALLASRRDNAWSLVDCASFVVMEQCGITDALTTDHHFEQAGFVRLLR
jgi:predicted nucleic acid-binding protein